MAWWQLKWVVGSNWFWMIAWELGKSDVGGQSNARIPSCGSRREERLRDLIQWCKLKPKFEAKLSRNG
jgi:hypothetical protein